jgi:hypothetical protein
VGCFGLLKLTLHPDSCDSSYISVSDKVLDQGGDQGELVRATVDGRITVDVDRVAAHAHGVSIEPLRPRATPVPVVDRPPHSDEAGDVPLHDHVGAGPQRTLVGLWEACNAHGWFSVRRELLDDLLQPPYVQGRWRRAQAASQLDKWLLRNA